MSSPLFRLRKSFTDHLYFGADDDLGIDFISSIILSNRWKNADPVWAYIIGPPGSGKTELLRHWVSDEVFQLSTLGSRSLVSGFRPEGKRKGDPSLLPVLDGEVLVLKDFTTILGLHRETREKIISELRDAFDGTFARSFGNIGVVRYRSKFGLVAGVTPAIDSYYSVSQQLGERFIHFRFRVPDPIKATISAERNLRDKLEIRAAFGQATERFLDDIDPTDWKNVSLPPPVRRKILRMGTVVSYCRSHVTRRGGGRSISYVAEPEVGTRLAIQLIQLAKTHCLSDRRYEVDEDKDLRLLRRVCRDTLPSRNQALLRYLYKRKKREKNVFCQPSEITKQTPIGVKTVREICEDLTILKVLRERKRKRTLYSSWAINDRIFGWMEETQLWRE